MRLVLLNIVIVFVLVGCQFGDYSETKYVAYMFEPDNGLVVEKFQEDWKISLQYRTKEFMALIEKGKYIMSIDDFDNVVSEYEGHEYYLLKFQYEGEPGLKKVVKDSLNRFFQFDFKSSISCVISTDTLNPSMYHYETGGAIDQEYRILLAFEEKVLSNRQILIGSLIRDRLKIEISEKALINLPNLKND